MNTSYLVYDTRGLVNLDTAPPLGAHKKLKQAKKMADSLSGYVVETTYVQGAASNERIIVDQKTVYESTFIKKWKQDNANTDVASAIKRATKEISRETLVIGSYKRRKKIKPKTKTNHDSED